MGPLIKYTNRLILRVENESKAKQVLDLYLRNRLPFEQYEPTRPASFYTQDYHWSSLHREYIAYTMGTFLRYYIYLKDRPDKIIGAINFNIFRTSREPYAEIGYKIDALNQRRKTLQNGINNSAELSISKDAVVEALRKMGLSESIRGEALTLAQFAELSDLLCE